MCKQKFNVCKQKLERSDSALLSTCALYISLQDIPPENRTDTLEMLLAYLAPTAFSTHGAPKATTTAGRSRHHTMLAEGLPKAVVFDLDGCLWAPDMCE